MQVSTLRPGYLVSLKTSLKGNVRYNKQMLEAEHETQDGELKARWETERTIKDKVEHEEAVKARTAARGAVTRICVASTHGLLCPEVRKAELEVAMKEARKIADDFNATAAHTRLSVFIIPGYIAPSDKEAILAINSEIRDLIDTMIDGVNNLDPAMIREAANKAHGLAPMLTLDMAGKVQDAVDVARSAARKIVSEKPAGMIDADKAKLQRQADAAFLAMGHDGEAELNLDAIENALDQVLQR